MAVEAPRSRGFLLTAPAALFAASLAVLSLARAGLLLAYPEAFAGISGAERLHAFARGVRFDASITLAILGSPLSMLLFPVRRLAWRQFFGWCGFASLAGMALLAIGDLIYFDQVGRHAGPEAAAIPREAPQLLRLAFAEHPLVLLVFAGGVAALAWAWRGLLHREIRAARRPWIEWAIALAFFPAMLVVIRGGVQSKPMAVVDAFEGIPRPAGLLALPGVYSILHGFVSTEPAPARVMPAESAAALAQEFLRSPRETPVDPRFPLLRHREPATLPPAPPPNIVVVMLEGWSTSAIDAYRSRLGLEPDRATPVFDELAANGLLFTNVYANGQRSAESFSALLAGIPALPGVRYLGLGMEQNRLRYVGHLAKENGVRSTIFVRGALRDSFHLDSIASIAGFDRYLGFEDIDAEDHLGREHPWGASDERTFRRASAEFARAPEPFLGWIFTLSTHRPWIDPGTSWHLVPHDTDEHRYLNTLHYADHQLGQFLARAKEAGWYDRTVFVLVSDHYPPLPDRAAIDAADRHRVPFLIFGKGIAAGVREDSASHLDLVPTIMDLGGWSGTHASLGRSLLERDPATAAAGPLVTGDLVTWIEASGSVTHDLHRRVSGTGDAAAQQAMEARMLALLQVALDGLRTNRIADDP